MSQNWERQMMGCMCNFTNKRDVSCSAFFISMKTKPKKKHQPKSVQKNKNKKTRKNTKIAQKMTQKCKKNGTKM